MIIYLIAQILGSTNNFSLYSIIFFLFGFGIDCIIAYLLGCCFTKSITNELRNINVTLQNIEGNYKLNEINKIRTKDM